MVAVIVGVAAAQSAHVAAAADDIASTWTSNGVAVDCILAALPTWLI